MSAPREEGALRAWAIALALFVLALPVFNPDVFWHLSAGRWIWEHGRVPTTDPLSFTRHGAPWIDFEWLVQLIWLAAERLGGLRGLWTLKVLLLAAAWLPVDGLLRDKNAGAGARAAALAVWCSAAVHQADLRADLISAAFFAVILRRLESGRASFLFGFGLFALWANLHAGFALGLLLYPAAFFAARLARRRAPEGLGAEFAGAALGTTLNPYGLALYGALRAHADADLPSLVVEWSGLSFTRPFHWPVAGALAAAAVAAWLGRRRAGPLALGTAAALGAATVASMRFGIFFAAAGAVLFGTALPALRVRPAAGVLLVASLLLGAAAGGRVAWGEAFQDAYVARRAVDFVVRERESLRGLKLYNATDWGGYLGWRSGELVYGDGRYLFHEQIAVLQNALSAPTVLSALAEREALDAFLLPRYPGQFSVEYVRPDGTKRMIRRPWHRMFFPPERWALVYWDERALFFVSRTKTPKAWLAAHEYRWLRPGDREALEEAVARGDVSAAVVEAEAVRHRAETSAETGH